MSNKGTSAPPATQDLPTEADYASSLSQRPVPYFAGRCRLPLSWITDVLNVESINTPSTSSGKGGGGGKKGGGAGNSQKTYYSTIAGILAYGPADYVLAVDADNAGSTTGVFTWSGTYARSGAVYTDLTPTDSSDLLSSGRIRLYWGGESQVVDPALYGHPTYAGYLAMVLTRFKMGDSRGTPRDINVTMARLPVVDTSIVGATANTFSTDGQYQVNPVAAMAEIFLSAWGFGWPVAMLDATSWHAEAAELWSNRQIYGECSCFFDSFEAAVSKLTDLCVMADVVPRWLPNGTLGLARVLPGYIPSNANTFDARHFRDKAPLTPKGSGLSGLATRVQVDFYNADTGNTPVLWKQDTVQASDLWALQTMGFVPSVLKVSRPFVQLVAQAQMHGAEAMRRQSVPPLAATAYLRSAEIAVDTGGNPILPGDKHYFDIDPQPGGSSLPALAVVTSRTDFADGSVDLELQFDGFAQVVPQFPSWTGTTVTPPSAASITHALVVPQFPTVTEPDAGLYVLATRPDTGIHGFKSFFGISGGGDFVELGNQDGFAARAGLVSDISAGATTVRLSITDGDSGPDGYLAAQTPENATAAESDVLLAILAHIDGNGAIVITSGQPVMEFVSLVSRSAVSAGVYDYVVLRGRQGTTAAAWTAAGSIAWIVPLSHLTRFSIPAMDAESGSGDTNYVRLASYTVGAEDQTSPLPSFAVKFPAVPLTAGDEAKLTSDSCTVPAATDGSSPVLTNAITDMLVSEFGVDLTTTWSFAASPSSGVSGSFGSSPHLNRYTVSGFTVDSGYVDIIASKTGHEPITKRFNLAKARAGADGTPGGTAAPLPMAANGYTSGGTHKITINPPSGAPSGWFVQVGSPSGSAMLTAHNFPFTLTMANDTQTFDLIAFAPAYTSSEVDVESWNSLFL